MDSREDEQLRGITMKSSAISLHYNQGKWTFSAFFQYFALAFIIDLKHIMAIKGKYGQIEVNISWLLNRAKQK